MKPFLALVCALSFSLAALGQEEEANYKESRVPAYTLPEILCCESGKNIENVATWSFKRRPEILALFQTYVYGQVPETEKEVKISFQIQSVDRQALQGKATRKLVRIRVERGDRQSEWDLLLYLPNQVQGPKPVFLGINFYGNHTIHPDPEIPLPASWVRNNEAFGIANNVATEASRGVRANRWPVERILERGYGLANIYYGDIDPDYDDGFQNGVHPLFYREGQTQPDPEEWGSIGAWAWGLSKAMDYLVQDEEVDAKRVAVFGHSRLGKTSLWAGATDTRFSMVISNDSGCGGAALSRREFGETVARINRAFPHWFNTRFKAYGEKVNEMPVDQHMLIALMAPRPVYIASAAEDLWADPRGEFLSGLHASVVYELFGLPGLEAQKMPRINQPSTTGFVGYHIREGKHDVTPFDWEQYMNFADRHWSP